MTWIILNVCASVELFLLFWVHVCYVFLFLPNRYFSFMPCSLSLSLIPIFTIKDGSSTPVTMSTSTRLGQRSSSEVNLAAASRARSRYGQTDRASRPTAHSAAAITTSASTRIPRSKSTSRENLGNFFVLFLLLLLLLFHVDLDI